VYACIKRASRTHAHAVEKKMSDRPPGVCTHFAERSVVLRFSFGLGVARAGPYHRRYVGRPTRAVFRWRFPVTVIVSDVYRFTVVAEIYAPTMKQ